MKTGACIHSGIARREGDGSDTRYRGTKSARDARMIGHLLAGYLRWYQALCLLAVVWLLVQPAGIAIRLPLRAGWIVGIGGWRLGLYRLVGPNSFLLSRPLSKSRSPSGLSCWAHWARWD